MKHFMLIAAIVAFCGLCHAEDENLAVVSYSADTFKEAVPNDNHFVMFYAPW